MMNIFKIYSFILKKCWLSNSLGFFHSAVCSPKVSFGLMGVGNLNQPFNHSVLFFDPEVIRNVLTMVDYLVGFAWAKKILILYAMLSPNSVNFQDLINWALFCFLARLWFQLWQSNLRAKAFQSQVKLKLTIKKP